MSNLSIVIDWQSFLLSLGWVTGVIIAVLLLHGLLFKSFRKFAERTKSIIDDSLVKYCKTPTRYLFLTLGIQFALTTLNLSPKLLNTLKHVLSLGVIFEVAWLIIALTYVLDDVVLERFDIKQRDNLQARKVYTQLLVFKRVVIFIVVILAFGTALMTFDKVRQLGASILTSAGIAGLVVGMAAQRIISNFLAGLQIAITQPIRIDDVVIVEGEWGWIEEITLTYVVVRIWDLRRLVLPINYFIEKPFQNWTRKSADIMGTVYIYADYRIPVEEVRKELRRIVEGNKWWDGKVCSLQVTNATEHTVELRALVSSPDSSANWDLRCYVREKLIEFIQRKYPEYLPRTRVELVPSKTELKTTVS